MTPGRFRRNDADAGTPPVPSPTLTASDALHCPTASGPCPDVTPVHLRPPLFINYPDAAIWLLSNREQPKIIKTNFFFSFI